MLLRTIKKRTGRCYYQEVSDLLRPIYSVAGLDPNHEGLPSPDSLKMLARRGDRRWKKFLEESLKRSQSRQMFK